MARAKVLTYQPTRATCELRDDWRSWSQAKREDGLFMSCPRCGVYGSHIGEAAGSREGSEEVRGG